MACQQASHGVTSKTITQEEVDYRGPWYCGKKSAIHVEEQLDSNSTVRQSVATLELIFH